jgi:hypothetical protein
MNAQSQSPAIRTLGCWAAICLAVPSLFAQPVFTRHPTPTNQSVSLGATAVFRVTATTANPIDPERPITYEWRHADVPLVWATNASLTLTNVQTSDAGPYTVAVTDATGTTNSNPAILDVDPTFTKITTGVLVTEKAVWRPAAWGDYNNDGYPDVYLHQRDTGKDLICRNNGDGSFTKITDPSLRGTATSGAWGSAWGDFDNDGYLDLFIANNGGKNVLLRNRGDGSFEKIATGPGAEGVNSSTGVWGDYDRDGFLDLFVANAGMAFQSGVNWFYRNQGDGSFARLTTNQVGLWLKESVPWALASWVDYDQDGRLDLLLPVGSKTRLYRNLGDGSFATVTNLIACDTGAWADYDNDGQLDLFGASMAETPNVLYHNEGSGTFRKMTVAEVGSIVTDKGVAGGVAWGDYDNDGFQDLFVARGWWYQSGAGRQKSLLYHNNGDGTFTRIDSGSIANELGQSLGGYWIDYDRDGCLDLFISEYGNDTPSANRLFRNSGNSNHWFVVNCVGTSSPRFGTGAKIRAKATIRGKEMWQLRLIDAGGTCWGGQSFEAHFGLGDATTVDTLRIEWPSGIVQELHNVAAKQHLTVTEPVKLVVQGPGAFQIKCWKGMQFEVQATTDFAAWTALATVTNLTGSLQWTDAEAVSQSGRFYRVKSL